MERCFERGQFSGLLFDLDSIWLYVYDMFTSQRTKGWVAGEHLGSRLQAIFFWTFAAQGHGLCNFGANSEVGNKAKLVLFLRRPLFAKMRLKRQSPRPRMLSDSYPRKPQQRSTETCSWIDDWRDHVFSQGKPETYVNPKSNLATHCSIVSQIPWSWGSFAIK